MPPIPVHDDSFGGAINLNQGLLSSENLDRARQAFHNLVQRYEGQQLDLQVRINPTSRKSYKKITLIRETYSHCKNQDALLQHFFTSLGVMYYQDTESDFAKGLSTVEDFLSQPPADHQAMLLFDYSDDLLIFYAKMKTRLAEDALKTPSHHSKNATPNEQRKEKLRTDCLRRDHHRCVVTHMFHRAEAYRRRRESGRLKIARDDEGKVIDIRQPGGECYDLEVAHIVPFFILQPPEGMELDHSQRFAITVLNMFDANITALIGGVKRDTPKNALTLAKSIYPAFGAFEIFFDETEGSHNVYRVSSHDEVISDANELPRNVDFNYPICQDIDPPSRRLLAIHRAISEILHLSMAREYIDEVFREVEEPCAQSNGSTNLGDILSLKLNDTIRSNSV